MTVTALPVPTTFVAKVAVGVPLTDTTSLSKGVTLGVPVKVPLKVPMDSFFTAGVRGGSSPSMVIDLLGESGKTLRYCLIKLR